MASAFGASLSILASSVSVSVRAAKSTVARGDMPNSVAVAAPRLFCIAMGPAALLPALPAAPVGNWLRMTPERPFVVVGFSIPAASASAACRCTVGGGSAASGVAPLRNELGSSTGAAKVGVRTLVVGCNAAVANAGVRAGLGSALDVVSGKESTASLPGIGKPFCAAGNPVASFAAKLVEGWGWGELAVACAVLPAVASVCQFSSPAKAA